MLRWSPALLALSAAATVAAGCAPTTTRQTAAPAPVAATPAPARIERPIPGPVVPERGFAQAVAAGTRTATGRPGPGYWQNRAGYTIRARVDPSGKRLSGSTEIAYQNRSPDRLAQLHVDLTQNHHAPGVVRNEAAEVTGGYTLSRVSVNGQALSSGGQGARYVVDGTRMVILPPRPVAPGETVRIALDFSYAIPQAGASGRMGYSRDNLVYLAYWYPQMTVYDDVVGWHPDPFLGTSEFYADFASYDVTLEAPAGWVVMGTGELANADQVLAPAVAQRLRAAMQSDTVVHVLRADDPRGTAAGQGGMLSWRFTADSVRDAAYSLMRGYNWDAARIRIGDQGSDGRADYSRPDYARADAFWRPTAPRWRNAWRYVQHSIDFLSRYTGVRYPWSHMTAVEGEDIIGGGMEYPMMTLIGSYNTAAAGDSALYYVTAHELAHMWVPMIVSNDERRYAWMDEGTTTFNENQARKEFYPGSDTEGGDRSSYLNLARTGGEGPIMRRSNFHYTSNAYGVASYSKPATLLPTLRALLGEETFNRAYREYLDRWKYKHPYPWDMWNTFEDVSGRDLDWFWQSWYNETWTLDHAVENVSASGGQSVVTVRDVGNAIMPARLTVTFADGRTQRVEVPVETWLAGARTATLRLDGSVTRVVIDAGNEFPDIDRANNAWPRS